MMAPLLWRVPTIGAAALLILGCAQGKTVQVTGTQKAETPIPSHVTYVVLPTKEVEKDRDFPTYAKMVAAKLTERGYRETDPKVAKLGVFLAYGVTDASTASPTTTSSGFGGAADGMRPSGGASTSGSGSYGVAISSPNAPPFPAFTTQVAIVLIDYEKSRSTGILVELWRGETLSRDASRDLPRTVPILIEAAFRHFGQATSKDLPETIQEDDPAVQKLRESK